MATALLAPPSDAALPLAEPIHMPPGMSPGMNPFAEPEPEQASGTNMFTALLRRWPWLLVGLGGGLILGLLYHMQRPPVYQSNAQLLVIKNRVDMQNANAGATAYVEDYVATQVTLLRSQKIIELAAQRLDDHRPFVVPPPPIEQKRERIDFMTTRFSVAREREPGTTTLSNVLALAFRSPDPSDAPKYLKAIIDAYQAELTTLYEEASTTRLRSIAEELKRYEALKNIVVTRQQAATRELLEISQEPITGIGNRITANTDIELKLERDARKVEQDLEAIKSVRGAPRQQRIQVMLYLGIQPYDPRASSDVNARTPEDLLFQLKLLKRERGIRFGDDHQEMVDLNSRIKMVEEIIASQRGENGGGAARQLDELDRHEIRLFADAKSFADQLEQVRNRRKSDEDKAKRMGKFQAELERAKADADRYDTLMREKGLEHAQVEQTRAAGGYTVQAITKPAPGIQVAPILYQSLLLGGVLGLLLGGGLAFLAELSDRSFRTPAEIRRRLGAPVLGHIPRIQTHLPPTRPSVTGLDPSLPCFLRPASTEAEAYRGVRTQLYFSTQGRGHQVIQVTSPTPGDGKSTLAANLAISIAQSGKRVVLLDCDFRKPRVHKIFKINKPEIGLASVMAGEADLRAAVQPCEVENLALMPCGPRPANPAELLTAPKFQDVLDELKRLFDFVIVDTPPVLAVTDPSAVAPRVDGVLLVFRMTKNARPFAERAREQLAAVGARVLGVIVNASATRAAGYGGYGYTYQYDYQYTDNYATTDDLPAKG